MYLLNCSVFRTNHYFNLERACSEFRFDFTDIFRNANQSQYLKWFFEIFAELKSF